MNEAIASLARVEHLPVVSTTNETILSKMIEACLDEGKGDNNYFEKLISLVHDEDHIGSLFAKHGNIDLAIKCLDQLCKNLGEGQRRNRDFFQERHLHLFPKWFGLNLETFNELRKKCDLSTLEAYMQSILTQQNDPTGPSLGQFCFHLF